MTKQYTGLTAKLHNRRVHVGQCKDDDSYCLCFKRLPDEEEKERIVTTQLVLSGEAMETLVELYLHLQGESLYDFRIAKVRSEIMSKTMQRLFATKADIIAQMMDVPPAATTFENNDGVWEEK